MNFSIFKIIPYYVTTMDSSHWELSKTLLIIKWNRKLKKIWVFMCIDIGVCSTEWHRQKLDPSLAEIEVIAQLMAAPLVRERSRARERPREKPRSCKLVLSALGTTSFKELAGLLSKTGKKGAGRTVSEFFHHKDLIFSSELFSGDDRLWDLLPEIVGRQSDEIYVVKRFRPSEI